MSTIKINELATSDITLSDYFAKADGNGVATKNTIQGLQTFLNTIGVVGYRGILLSTDAAVTEDGIYIAGDTGTYTNNGGFVINLNNKFVLLSRENGVFVNPVEIPLSIALDTVFDKLNNTDGATMTAIDNYILSEYQRKTETENYTTALTLANGSTEITGGFQIPIGSTGNDTYFYLRPSLYNFDTTLRAGNILKWNVSLLITNYLETTQPQTFQIIEQTIKDNSTVATTSASSSVSFVVDGSNQTANIEITKTLSQSDIDNEYYFRFYLGFKNTDTVTSDVDVTLVSVAYTNDVLLNTLIRRNQNKLSKRVVNPAYTNKEVVRSVDGRFGVDTAIKDAELFVDNENKYQIDAKGVWEALNDSQFIYFSPLDYYNIINLRDNIDVVGEHKDKSFVIGKLDPNLGSSFAYEKYQGVYIDAEANFKRFSVIFQTGRYALHIDGGFEGRLNDTYQLVEDCLFWHQGNTGDAFNRWGIGTAFGHGSNSGQITELKRCTFRNPNNGLFTHNNYDFDKPSITRYKDCEVISDEGNDDGNIIIQNLGSGVQDIFEVLNTKITMSPIKIQYDNLSITNLYADTNDINFVTDLEPRAIRNYDCKDICLRIDSLSTGGGSYVLLTQSSTAYDSLFGDSSQFVEINKVNEIYRYGYSRRTGNQGLSGYAYGDYNIKETATQNVYVNSLGKRLGDCTTVNKVLTLNIDGTTYNVTFDKNYNGTADSVAPNYTNAQIIAEINAVIGSVATASEFKVAKEYYPAFDGLEYRTYEDSSEALAGYGVVFTEDNKIRKALNTDNKIDGILLDSVATGEIGRIITKGRINRMQSDDSLRFQVNEVWAAPLPKPVGHEVGISTTTAGLFDPTASPKLLRCYEQDVYKIL